MKENLLRSHPTTLYLFNVFQRHAVSNMRCIIIIIALQLLAANAKGQLSLTGTSAVTVNFDGMNTSATATVPSGFKVVASTGAYASAGTATSQASTAPGGSASGAIYNFGSAATTTDRSLGFLGSGSFTPGTIYFAVTNNTGSTLSGFTLTWNYEKYRSGTRAWAWTFLTSATAGGAGAYADPVSGGGNQSYAADANNTTTYSTPPSISKSITISGLSLSNGSTYYIKWVLTGSGGTSNGQGLGIDDVVITPVLATCTGTPAAGTASAATTNICTTGSSVLSVSGSASGAGITYQWQSSSDSSSWGDISAATNAGYTATGITSDTYFRRKTTCTPSTTSTFSNGPKVTVTSITTSPSPTTIAAGGSTSFTVSATGAASYQWQRSTTGAGGTFVNITSATLDATGTYSGFATTTTTTSNTLTLTGVPASWNGYAYRCVVTNTCGNVTSADALLNVTSSACSGTPSPGTASAAVPNFCTSGSTTLSLTAYTAGIDITYQWQSSSDSTSWSDISGETNITYTTPTISVTTYYRCVTTCTGSALSSVSNTVTVTVTRILTGPSSVSITPGSSTSFTAIAAAGASYQWQRSTTGTGGTYANITSSTMDATGSYSGFATTGGSDTNALSLSSVPSSWNNYAYRCVVTNTCGSVTSGGATLNVECSGTPAAGTATAAISSFCGSGSTTVSLTGFAAGSGISFQWEASSDSATWTPVSGATNTSYATGTVSATTYYHCIVSCSYSSLTSISNDVRVRINSAPTLSVTPAGGDVCSGTSGLSMAATGAATYSWTPSTGLSAATGSTVTANPTTTTIYTITGASSSGCVATTTVTATYRLSPAAISLTPSSITMCPGAAPQRIVVSGGNLGPTTVSSGSIGVTINGAANATTTHTINVAGIPSGVTITGASVNFTASMPWQDDYVINLVSPSGQIFNLANQKGTHTSAAGAYTNTTISSAGTASLPVASTVPASTTYAADATNSVGGSPYISNVTSWNSLMGTLNGTWRIVFYQATTFSNASGTLSNWSLTLNYNYRAVTWSPSTRLFTNAAGSVAYSGSAADTVYAAADTAASAIIYTATSAHGSCVSFKNDTVTVVSSPVIAGTFTISRTSVCPGDTDSLIFTGTHSGTGAGAFTSYNWAGPGGYASTSTSSSISFIPTTSAMSGSYSVSVTYANPGCTSQSDTSGSRLRVGSPIAYNVTGGFGCATSGLTIGLSNTETATTYQLFNGTTRMGLPILGTGSSYVFGTFTTPGTYVVYADNGSCAQYMNDSAVIYDTITVYNITGGGVASGAGCVATGLVIGLNNSQPGVSYQLYNGSSPVVSAVSGTGSSISFNGGSPITAAGTYSVTGTIGSCNQAMNGTSIIYNSLSAYTVTGGTGCSTPGLAIGLSNSEAGVSYQLYKNLVVTGSPVTGTGAAISFGTLTTNGTYTVQASVGASCNLAMTGNAFIYGNPSFTVSPTATALCGAPGRTITVTPSAAPLTILDQSFDGTISNDGWSADYTAVQWAQTPSSTYAFASSTLTSSGKFYILYNGSSINTSSHLISPSFSLAGLATATLTFHSFFDLGSSETAGADISTNGGSTWTSIFSASNTWSGSTAYTFNTSTYLRTISLNAYVGNSNVKIRFRYDKASAGTSYIFAVDNAKITGTVPTTSYSWAPGAGLSVTTGLTATAIPTVSTIYTVSVLGCTVGTANVTVDSLPSAGIVSVSDTIICVGSGTTLTLSEGGTPSGPAGATLTSYAWSGPSSFTSTGSGSTVGNATLTPTTAAASGIYSLTVTYNEPGCTSLPALSPSVTVSQLPGISIGSTPQVCQPVSTINLSYSSPVGSPVTYSIAWDTAAISAGFTNVTNATLASSRISISVPSGATGSFSGSLTVSNGTCTSPAYTIATTIYPQPLAAITSAPGTCAGYATNITFTGTPGASIAYSIDGGATINATLTGGTYVLSTGAISTPHTYKLIDAHNIVCSTAIDSTITINPVLQQWVGGASGMESDWNTSANWACGFVPGATDNVTIPAGTTYAPQIAPSASGTTGSLTIASGATVSVGTTANLNVKGTLKNNGNITGAGNTVLNGTSAQVISGIGNINNFTLDNTSGATVDTASRMTIKGVLTVTDGNLATGDSLVLYSDSLSTARIAPLPASGATISGNAKVMVWVQGGRRAYRFWSHPFSNYIGLNQVQNYIDVTGPGGAANGFTGTATNSPSAFRYNPLVGNSSAASDPGWKPFASISTTLDSNRLHQYQGIRLFFRGAKGTGLGTAPYTPASVTVAQWGALNQGTQTVTLSKGSTNPYQDYNMVGNPYASPVDIGTIVHNSLVSGDVTGPSYFVWNPSLGTAGQFQAQFINTTTAVPYYLQACNAFQVRAASNGSTLTFTESNKATIATSYLFKEEKGYLSLKVYDADYHLYDMAYINFNNGATEGMDNNLDAAKPFGGADLNFYTLTPDHTKMIVDARPYVAGNVIPLGISAGYQQEYIIKAEGITLPENQNLYLHDKLLKQYVLLQSGTEYRFVVSGDAATQGDNRFELSMKPAENKFAATKGLQVTINPNPATDDVNISFETGGKDNVSVRIIDLSGVSIYNKELGTVVAGTINVPMVNYAPGIYMVELSCGNEKSIQRLVKE